MISHTYKAGSLAEAKRAAEAELGDDAVVLSTRRIPRQGISGVLGGTEVEITAARRRALMPTPTDMLDDVAPSKRTPFSTDVFRAEPPPSQNDLVALRAEVRSEMRSIRSLVNKQSQQPALEAELAALRDTVERLATPEPRGGRLARLLRTAGIEGPAATTITRALRDRKKDEGTIAEAFRDAVADLVFPVAWPLAKHEPCSIALVGPSGVGKTTTAAKLAAQAVLDHNRTATLISCDRFRVGAVEQLERYAHLIGADFEVASDAEDLADRVRQNRSDVLIVDTAGQGGREDDGLETNLLNTLRRAAPNAAPHVLLCLPASVRAADAERFARIFLPCGATSLVVTKLDETRAPGGLVHGSVATKLPVTGLCFGPRVPEDMSPATSGKMLDYLVPRNGSGKE